VGLTPALLCAQSYLYVSVICDLKLSLYRVDVETGGGGGGWTSLFPGGEVIILQLSAITTTVSSKED
jgi:hypothetical protein